MKIGYMLLSGSAALAAAILTAAPTNAQTALSIEIVRQPSAVPDAADIGVNVTSAQSTYRATRISEEALLNDDRLGDAAIARYGCDCAGCRRSLAQVFQMTR